MPWHRPTPFTNMKRPGMTATATVMCRRPSSALPWYCPFGGEVYAWARGSRWSPSTTTTGPAGGPWKSPSPASRNSLFYIRRRYTAGKQPQRFLLSPFRPAPKLFPVAGWIVGNIAPVTVVVALDQVQNILVEHKLMIKYFYQGHGWILGRPFFAAAALAAGNQFNGAEMILFFKQSVNPIGHHLPGAIGRHGLVVHS